MTTLVSPPLAFALKTLGLRPGYLADQKKVAIEIELTLKGKDRLTGILKGYIKDLSVDEVWYYCSLEIINSVSKLAEKMTFIKIHGLNQSTL